MKMRCGFVSNSSSSSFIVGFNDPLPKTASEMVGLLFPKGFYKLDTEYYKEPISHTDAAERVLKDLQTQTSPLTKKQILDSIVTGYFEDYPERPDYYLTSKSYQTQREYRQKFGSDIWNPETPEQKKLAKKYRAAYRKENKDREKEIVAAAKKLLDKQWATLKNKKCFKFEYCDNEGEFFAQMEHAGVFDNVDHIRISHH